jgi:hypothetical protein
LGTDSGSAEEVRFVAESCRRYVKVQLTRTHLKIVEEDHEAGELDEAKEVLAVVLSADEDAALPLDPGEEAFDEPTSHVTA